MFDDEKIQKVIITGLFGAKINKLGAKRIGILPHDIELKNVSIKQNAALLGAKKLLLSPDIENTLKPVIKRIKHIELHKEPHFQDEFTRALHF